MAQPEYASKLSVLFVCLGNICRSPLAEAAMREAAERKGLDIEIDSAGTGDWHVGHPPDRRAQAAAQRHGVEIGHYRARQVTRADFDRFDRIIALDRSNLRNLQAIQPANSRAQLSLLLDHLLGHEGTDVADPYYGDEAGFETCWAEVSAATAALAAQLWLNR